VRAVAVFLVLLAVKLVSRLFYRQDFRFVGDLPSDPWRRIRVVAFLNHTSLYEPIFAGGAPLGFLWRLARHGVVPAAQKTLDRPLVGLLFRFVARNVVAITRERDHTWAAVLGRIHPDSMVVILPEGRMKRRGGLDAQGQPMTVRGGIADILAAVPEGRMLLAYSAGLHHVQAPGERFPRLFKTVRMRLELLEIADYRRSLAARGDFKEAVKEDLERRRDHHCALAGGASAEPAC
jgi:hypothetical protein